MLGAPHLGSATEYILCSVWETVCDGKLNLVGKRCGQTDTDCDCSLGR